MFFNYFVFWFLYSLIYSFLVWPQIHHIYTLIAQISTPLLSAPLFYELHYYFIINLKRERGRERRLYLHSQRKYCWIKTSSWLNSSRKSVTTCTTVEEVVVVCCQNRENFTTSVPHNAIVILCDSNHLIGDRKYFVEDLSGMSPEIFLFGNHYIV